MSEIFEIVGAIAQLGERSVRNAEVGGSTPLRSNDVKSRNTSVCGVCDFVILVIVVAKCPHNGDILTGSVCYNHNEQSAQVFQKR